MPQLELNPYLHPADYDGPLKETYLGMAHIAGTGPAGVTCRECRYWHLTEKGKPVSPGYYSDAIRTTAGLLKPAKCNYPISHKANRRFPHYAKACRLFDPAEEPFPPASRLTGKAE